MKISLDFEITPEEIFSIGKLIEDKIAKEIVDDILRNPKPCPVVDGKDLWTGKNVSIKSSTPDSEISSWLGGLERNIVYGVTKDEPRDGSINIKRRWYPKIWFELVG